MKRFTGVIVVMGCALLCAAAAVLWGMSYWHAGMVQHTFSNGDTYFLCSDRGRVSLVGQFATAPAKAVAQAGGTFTVEKVDTSILGQLQFTGGRISMPATAPSGATTAPSGLIVPATSLQVSGTLGPGAPNGMGNLTVTINGNFDQSAGGGILKLTTASLSSDPNDLQHHFMGFGWTWPVAFLGAIAIPHWFLVLVAAIPPGVRVLHHRRRHRRRRAGLCVACGYDLRATAQRCPECGRENLST
jgi:hypothetical protein